MTTEGTQEIAERSGISQPYLYRLVFDKQHLFVATVDHVSVLLGEALAPLRQVDLPPDPPSAALTAARSAYAALVQERTVLRFLLHASCATEEPLIADAVGARFARQVDGLRELLGDDGLVRQFFGVGMLDNVVIALGLADVDEPWARTLASGSPPVGAGSGRAGSVRAGSVSAGSVPSPA